MPKRGREHKANRYIRERIRQARTETNQTQEDLSKILEKTRVAVSDLERGRVTVGAADLMVIATHYRKPISYFYPPAVSVQSKLSPLQEELITRLGSLPETQQYIALEYVRSQVKVSEKAKSRELADQGSRSNGNG